MTDEGGDQDLGLLRRMLARERAAREQAEMLLENKSRDLYATLSRLQRVVGELDAARRQASITVLRRGCSWPTSATNCARP